MPRSRRCCRPSRRVRSRAPPPSSAARPRRSFPRARSVCTAGAAAEGQCHGSPVDPAWESARVATPTMLSAIGRDQRQRRRAQRHPRAALAARPDRAHAVTPIPYRPRSPDHVEHGVGDEIVERPAVEEAGPQVRARHLEPGHLDTDPVDRVVGQRHRVARAVDHNHARTGDAPRRPAPRCGCRPRRRRRRWCSSSAPGSCSDSMPACRRCTSGRRPVDLVVGRPPDARTSSTAASTIASRSSAGVMSRLADLLPRHVGDHQDQSIEGKGMADVDGGDQVADVGRIERAAEHPDVLGFSEPEDTADESTGEPAHPGCGVTCPVLTCLLQ